MITHGNVTAEITSDGKVMLTYGEHNVTFAKDAPADVIEIAINILIDAATDNARHNAQMAVLKLSMPA